MLINRPEGSPQQSINVLVSPVFSLFYAQGLCIFHIEWLVFGLLIKSMCHLSHWPGTTFLSLLGLLRLS